jgi:phosphoglycolate phosphatase-like HAD superfamily hydrolase
MTPMSRPGTLALDFDGVLCNGVREYFQTAWTVYQKLWSTDDAGPPAGLFDQFTRLRAVVEMGWEMPMVLRAALTGWPEAEILNQWLSLKQQLLVDSNLKSDQVAQWVDGVRDQWIQADVEGWLALQEFYPGVIASLQTWLANGLTVVIITTKEQRFVESLLARGGVTLPAKQIFGKGCKRPKAETLRELLQTSDTPIWFVEDRLQTLLNVAGQEDLQSIQLFLGDWGYNTEVEHRLAEAHERIKLLSLEQFNQLLIAPE